MAVTEVKSSRSSLNWLLLLLSLVVLMCLLALGTWQVQRLQWKEALLAQIEARINAEPADLASIERIYAETGDVEYRPMRVEGAFRHTGERHYFATWKGQSGYFVHTPLRLEDGRFIFVNRGFVPFDRKEADTRAEGQIVGGVRISGLARNGLDEKPSFIVPDNDIGQNIFYWKDLGTMARTAGLPDTARVLPFYVDADDSPNAGGLPVGGVTRIDLPNSHLQYAITWYGLAAALCGVLFVWWRRNRRRS
ncbi:SURF1 family protein [Nitratireductor rhodophyticola]|uniref:SURF1 family protein n=1 Tax=Nitratireductor rhodophyticola TaxID=2854036 RepID=UPI002AC97190|nr:SURF1 family protein [Nitratireductor rhodophyticola]WPZ14241.1 SURF1 family protein [Nitratireductor rhodophyticola]